MGARTCSHASVWRMAHDLAAGCSQAPIGTAPARAGVVDRTCRTLGTRSRGLAPCTGTGSHRRISSHHTGWCFLKAQMRHDTHALAQTMHIHATSIRITHADRSSKHRRADPLERLNRPNRGPMHPPQRARHGGCRRRGPCLQQWPQRHDIDRLAAAIDLCVDPCGWRRRQSSLACTAAREPSSSASPWRCHPNAEVVLVYLPVQRVKSRQPASQMEMRRRSPSTSPWTSQTPFAVPLFKALSSPADSEIETSTCPCRRHLCRLDL